MNREATLTDILPSPDALPAGIRGTALVVDDETTNRLILRSLLGKMGYRVLEAADGVEAVEVYQAQRPDIIFMDIMMPRMNGYDATRRIKQLCGEHFVPVIFLTAITDEDAMAASIEAGGDDFINKPFRNSILKAKILAMERIRGVHRSVSNLYQMLRREEEIAQQVFANAVESGNSVLDARYSSLLPASTFSGDMLLSGYTPAGDLNVLLGDFTGHGLASALGALPASEVFRTMTAKGFALEQIIAGINGKLRYMLPTGMFLAAQMVQVRFDLSEVRVLNCGMPDVLLIDGRTSRIKHRFRSTCMPLAIRREFRPGKQEIQHYEITVGDRVLLASDGLYEAANPNGEPFGGQRVEQVIRDTPAGTRLLDRIVRELQDFCGDAPQADDVSLAEIPLTPEIRTPGISRQTARAAHLDTNGKQPIASWGLQLKLDGRHLRSANPVPLLISQIQELEDLGAERQSLYTVLTELFVNALDHGLLQLDSSLKASHDGFLRYFEERDRRLAELQDGSISIDIKVESYANGGRMAITVSDSGRGFDLTDFAAQNSDSTLPSGRGLLLVRELCDTVEFVDPGNRIIAVYSWSRPA